MGNMDSVRWLAFCFASTMLLLLDTALASSVRDLVDFGTSYTYPVRLQGLNVPVPSGGWSRNYRSKLRKPLLADSGASLADLQQLSQTGSSDDHVLPESESGANAQALAPIAYGEAEPVFAPPPPNQGEASSSYEPSSGSGRLLNPLSYQPSQMNPGAAYADLVAAPASQLKPVHVATPARTERFQDGSQAYKYKLGYGFAQKTRYGLKGLGSIVNRGYGSTSGTEAGYDTAAEKLPLNSYLKG